MSCFLIPLTQAIATTAIRHHYSRQQATSLIGEDAFHRDVRPFAKVHNSPWLRHLPKLELLLWGGSLMLVIDHILSGELSWSYPFFTALTEADGVQALLREILSLGIPMSLVPTLIYLFLVYRSFHQTSSSSNA